MNLTKLLPNTLTAACPTCNGDLHCVGEAMGGHLKTYRCAYCLTKVVAFVKAWETEQEVPIEDTVETIQRQMFVSPR